MLHTGLVGSRGGIAAFVGHSKPAAYRAVAGYTHYTHRQYRYIAVLSSAEQALHTSWDPGWFAAPPTALAAVAAVAAQDPCGIPVDTLYTHPCMDHTQEEAEHQVYLEGECLGVH